MIIQVYAQSPLLLSFKGTLALHYTSPREVCQNLILRVYTATATSAGL